MRRKLMITLLSVLTIAGLASGTTAAADTAAPATPAVSAGPAAQYGTPAELPPPSLPSTAALPAPLPGAVAVYGPYVIRSYHDGRCLDADVITMGANGTKVQMWACNYDPQQRWYFHDLGNYNYLIQNEASGRILDGDSNTMCCDGTKVQLWDHIPGNLNQTWRLWTESDWDTMFQNNMYPYGQLDADLNGMCCNGTKVQLWHFIPNNPNNNQKWYLG
jgi:hypothetical protein